MARLTHARHVDEGVSLGSFASEALAVCPKCEGLALVTCESRYGFPIIPINGRVCCLQCSFQKLGRELSWHGPAKGAAKERCPHCGHKWLEGKYTSRSSGRGLRKWTGITCDECQKSSKVEIAWSPVWTGAPSDPAFGLPLWLQSPCCGEIFWAYNGSHLRALRDYIAADLRERTGVRQWSIFSRMPKWMSSHKNRKAVLACIDRLEKQFASLPDSSLMAGVGS
jgi:hypothetical protein